MNESVYNYVFFNIYADFHQPEFFSLAKKDNVKVFDHKVFSSGIANFLFSLHWSGRINSKIKLPYKKIWYKSLTRSLFTNNKPTCYVFLDGKYITENNGLYRYIKRIDPRNKVAIFFDDLVDKLHVDINNAKLCSDLIISFDKNDAEKYGLHYYNYLCYEATEELSITQSFVYDVYFLGNAKDRLTKIHEFYRRLTSLGLRCKFIVCGVNPDEMLYNSEIIYNEHISYKKNIENVKKSKCILELMQGEGIAPTLRLKEAQAYRRKLITNNSSIANSSYINKNMIEIVNKPEEIEMDFIRQPIDYVSFDEFDYHFKSERLLEYFESVNSDV